jgi:hypothetical protein
MHVFCFLSVNKVKRNAFSPSIWLEQWMYVPVALPRVSKSRPDTFIGFFQVEPK